MDIYFDTLFRKVERLISLVIRTLRRDNGQSYPASVIISVHASSSNSNFLHKEILFFSFSFSLGEKCGATCDRNWLLVPVCLKEARLILSENMTLLHFSLALAWGILLALICQSYFQGNPERVKGEGTYRAAVVEYEPEGRPWEPGQEVIAKNVAKYVEFIRNASLEVSEDHAVLSLFQDL